MEVSKCRQEDREMAKAIRNLLQYATKSLFPSGDFV